MMSEGKKIISFEFLNHKKSDIHLALPSPCTNFAPNEKREPFTFITIIHSL